MQLLAEEHSISFGVVRAFHQKYAGLSVLHLDAHADLRNYSNENKYSHACVARRIAELVPLTSVGVRSMSEEEHQYYKEKNIPVFLAKDIMQDDAWMQQVIDTLSDTVYVTLDVDVFDSSIMPATGTPQPGGLDWYRMVQFLKKLSEQRKVVGFDVTELAPQPSNPAPDFLAAKLVYKMIGFFFDKHTNMKQ